MRSLVQRLIDAAIRNENDYGEAETGALLREAAGVVKRAERLAKAARNVKCVPISGFGPLTDALLRWDHEVVRGATPDLRQKNTDTNPKRRPPYEQQDRTRATDPRQGDGCTPSLTPAVHEGAAVGVGLGVAVVALRGCQAE